MRYTQGRATISKDSPRALGVCDRCRFRYNHNQLSWQYQWSGTRLQKLRILVCESCKDVPQQQLRSIIIPPDPVPILNPRPDGPFGYENLLSSNDLSNWTAYHVTLTPNAAIAPDGSMTATSMIEDTSNNAHFSYINCENLGLSAGDVATCSIFAKAAGRNELDLSMDKNSEYNAYIAVDAENPYGEIQADGAAPGNPYIGRYLYGVGNGSYIENSGFFSNQGIVGTTVNFTNVGDGWWWIGFSFKVPPDSWKLASYLSDVFGIGYNYTGDGVSGVYLWKPQLVAGYSNVFPGPSYVGNN